MMMVEMTCSKLLAWAVKLQMARYGSGPSHPIRDSWVTCTPILDGGFVTHVHYRPILGQGDIQYDKSLFADVIFSQRRGQSQKPEEVYHLIESLVPNGVPC
jgi:N6-adenosine-specific RNA methylase IME4